MLDCFISTSSVNGCSILNNAVEKEANVCARRSTLLFDHVFPFSLLRYCTVASKQ